MHTINLSIDDAGRVLIIASDIYGLSELKEMINRVIVLKNNIDQTLIAENSLHDEVRIKFELIQEQ